MILQQIGSLAPRDRRRAGRLQLRRHLARVPARRERAAPLAEKRGEPEGVLGALFNLVAKNRRRYGGYIVHLGIVGMFLGFVGSAWNLEREVTLVPGQTHQIGNFDIKYLGTRMCPGNPKCSAEEQADLNKRMLFADFDVKENGKALGPDSPRQVLLRQEPRRTDDRGEPALQPAPRPVHGHRHDRSAEQARHLPLSRQPAGDVDLAGRRRAGAGRRHLALARPGVWRAGRLGLRARRRRCGGRHRFLAVAGHVTQLRLRQHQACLGHPAAPSPSRSAWRTFPFLAPCLPLGAYRCSVWGLAPYSPLGGNAPMVLDTASRVTEEAKAEALEAERSAPDVAEAHEPPPLESGGTLLTPELLSDAEQGGAGAVVVGRRRRRFHLGRAARAVGAGGGGHHAGHRHDVVERAGLDRRPPLGFEEALGMGAPSKVEEEKRSVLRALKDLEYERGVGKISPRTTPSFWRNTAPRPSG